MLQSVRDYIGVCQDLMGGNFATDIESVFDWIENKNSYVLSDLISAWQQCYICVGYYLSFVNQQIELTELEGKKEFINEDAEARKVLLAAGKQTAGETKESQMLHFTPHYNRREKLAAFRGLARFLYDVREALNSAVTVQDSVNNRKENFN